jgi:hypothetical protein
VCDWNEDGQRDILVGDRNGYTMIFVETGRGLTLLDTLRANGVKIDVGNNSNPDIVDWNEDGKKDILIGGESGTVRLYLNQGTDSNPVFTSYSNVQSGGVSISWYRINPRVWDLDLDGKKDLLVGENTAHVFFYRNVGTNASPVFNGYDSLELTNGNPIVEYYGLRPYFIDYNGDGLIDILTSDYYGYVRYYQNAFNPGVEEIEQTIVSNFTVTPNVTKDMVNISYSLTEMTLVSVEVYSSDGRLVDIVVDRSENIGFHELSWNRSNLAAGIYFIKLKVDATITTRKIIML